MYLLLTIVILLIISSAGLSALETAITATSPGRLQQLKSQGVIKATLLLKLIKTKEQIISTILTANSIVNIVATTIATSVAISIYGDELGTVISSIVMSIIIVIFAEVVPKAIAVSNAESIALSASDIIRVLLIILTPINYSLSRIVDFFCWLLNINLTNKISGTEEVRGLIEHQHQEGKVFNKVDRDMLEGVLDIKNMEVSEIMVHRSKMCTINADLVIEEFIATAMKLAHSRIPVWKESTDNIIGVLHIRDLIKMLYFYNFDVKKIKLQDLINDPWFIPENTLVSHQLSAFKQKRSHMALVVDEYGALRGVITLRDILKEIVGPIYDEHEDTTNNIVKINNTTYIIEGTSSIRDVNRELNWNLPDDNASTIAGLIMHHIQNIPKQGDIYNLFGLKITIDKTNSHYIQSVKVETANIDNNNVELTDVS